MDAKKTATNAVEEKRKRLAELRAKKAAAAAEPKASGSVKAKADSVGSIKTQIEEIYKVHCPEKVKHVGVLLQKFSGREQELLVKVKAK